MKALIKKNKVIRNDYVKSELDYYILSALTKNNILINLDKSIISSKFTFPKGKGTRIRNICVLTGRGRAINLDYKLSRLKFKEIAELGNISGILKK